jgi:hypothetical protein
MAALVSAAAAAVAAAVLALRGLRLAVKMVALVA